MINLEYVQLYLLMWKLIIWRFFPFFLLITLWGLYELINHKWSKRPSDVKKKKKNRERSS